MRPLVLLTFVLLAVRLYATTRVGFGDSEALYACWALHPQPAYLDHPGLVGLLARTIGAGAVPTPARAHLVSSVVATLVPWLTYATARALDAEERPATLAACVVALAPETAVGLFGMTPDLLLAPAWLGAIALAAVGLKAPPGSSRAASALLGAGVLAGVATAAKASGALLVVALAATYAVLGRKKSPEGAAARTIWPWAGLVAGVVVVLPVVGYEVRSGFPMLHHRLLDTRPGLLVTLRNAGGLIGGQLLYVSPLLAWLALRVGRDVVRDRARGVEGVLLFSTFAVPLVPLVILSLFSPGAEPHWIAPALLALPLAAARRPDLVPRRLGRAAAAVAGAFTAAAHAWVLLPGSSSLVPRDADPRADIASELYGWPTVLGAVKEQITGAATPFDPEGRETVIVGPHWTVCAQLHAGLPGLRVGCATPERDDFDGWLPRSEWRRADHVLFVTDNRFGGDGAAELPLHVQTSKGRVRILRGERVARTFELFLYDRTTSGARQAAPDGRVAAR